VVYHVINSFTKTEASVSCYWEISLEEFDLGLNEEKKELDTNEAILIKDRLQKTIGFPTILQSVWSYELRVGPFGAIGRVTISFYHKEGLEVEEKLFSSGFMRKEDYKKTESSFFRKENQ
jgi:hypothetical protein